MRYLLLALLGVLFAFQLWFIHWFNAPPETAAMLPKDLVVDNPKIGDKVINGFVQDSYGNSLSGVEILATLMEPMPEGYAEGAPPRWLAQSDATGYFIFSSLPPGAFDVTAFTPAGVASRDVRLPPEGTAIEVYLQTKGTRPPVEKADIEEARAAERFGATNPELGDALMMGKVVSVDGAPVAGVDVVVEEQPEERNRFRPSVAVTRWHTLTDEAGVFIFDHLPTGEFVVTAHSPAGEAAARGSVEESGPAGHVSLHLGPPRYLEGQILDEAGEPARDVLVFSLQPPQFRVKTDRQGRFTIGPFAQTDIEAALLVKARDKGPLLAALPLDSDGRHTIQLRPGIALRGAVRTRDEGKPVANITVRAVETEAGLESYTARSDNEGDWEIEGAREGTYRYTIDDARWALSTPPVVASSVGGAVDLAIAPAGMVRGRILREGAEDEPATRLAVEAVPQFDGGRTATAVTDLGGYYSFDGLLPGQYTVTPALGVDDVLIDVQKAPVAVVAGKRAEAPTLTIGEGALLAGRVLADDGTPAAHANVYVSAPETRSEVISLRTDAEGAFALRGVRPDEEVRIYAKKLDMQSKALGPAEPGAAGMGNIELTLALPSTGVLRGRVISAQGVPLPEIAVRYYETGDEETTLGRTTTDDDGAFSFDETPPGVYQVAASRGAHAAAAVKEVQVSEESPPALEEIVLP